MYFILKGFIEKFHLKTRLFTWKFKHLQKLLGESSALDRVGRFLGALPDFMVRNCFENILIILKYFLFKGHDQYPPQRNNGRDRACGPGADVL